MGSGCTRGGATRGGGWGGRGRKGVCLHSWHVCTACVQPTAVVCCLVGTAGRPHEAGAVCSMATPRHHWPSTARQLTRTSPRPPNRSTDQLLLTAGPGRDEHPRHAGAGQRGGIRHGEVRGRVWSRATGVAVWSCCVAGSGWWCLPDCPQEGGAAAAWRVVRPVALFVRSPPCACHCAKPSPLKWPPWATPNRQPPTNQPQGGHGADGRRGGG